MAISNEEYVSKSGNVCPLCGSRNIESESIEADGTVAWAFTKCHDCESEWNDLYKLTAYDILTDNHTEKPIETILDEVVDDAVDTCMNDSGYLRSLLRDHFSNMSHDEIRKLHHDAFDNSIDDE
jgi:formate dehydrogenase maturation protein FdhE